MQNSDKRNVKTPKQSGKTRKSGFATRSLVLQILRQIPEKIRLEEGLQKISEAKFAPEDRAFARLLLLSCLRFQWVAEKIALAHCPRRPSQLDRNILRLGVVQLVFLGVPAHAVLSETVALAAEKSRGFINAVLRKILDDWQSEPDQKRALERYVSVNAPGWYRQRLQKDWGEEEAETIMQAHATVPPLDLAFLNHDAREEFLRALADKKKSHLLPHGGLRLWEAENPRKLPLYDQGIWWVQDAAAQLPVWLLRRELAGARVLDLCAAPGGKTAQLVSYKADVVALDNQPHRLRRLRENMQRLHFSPKIVQADAREWHSEHRFDVVIIDAPCSASGTARRHPENILRDHEPHLLRTQQEIFSRALKLLKPQGILLYAVCSLRPVEGWKLCAHLSEQYGLVPWDFHQDDRKQWRSLIRFQRLQGNPRHQIQTLPGDALHLGGMDGFFVAAYKINGFIKS